MHGHISELQGREVMLLRDRLNCLEAFDRLRLLMTLRPLICGMT